jgi:hypothetical protein
MASGEFGPWLAGVAALALAAAAARVGHDVGYASGRERGHADAMATSFEAIKRHAEMREGAEGGT